MLRVSAGLSSEGSKEAGSDMSLMPRLFMAAAASGFTLNAGAATILLHTPVHRVTHEP